MRLTTISLFYAFLFFCSACLSLPALANDNEFTALDPTRMLRDIQKLSGPEFSGRQSGTVGGLASAAFVAQRFRQLGLTPAGDVGLGILKDQWGQSGPVKVAQIQAPTFLEFTVPTPVGESNTIAPEVGSGFLPVLDSPSIHVTAPVVFVGYGISDPAGGWDEYKGVEVRNRVVLFLRGKPSHYPKHIHQAEKEGIAREKGAVAFVTLTGPVLSPYAARRGMGFQPLAYYSNPTNERPLSGVWINEKIGTALFKAEGLDLSEVQKTLNKNPTIQSRILKTIVRMRWETTFHSGSFMNVLGIIPGSEPVRQQETIIIGAHRDHFGQQAGLVFPGADDNASGTALLLEIARILMKNGPSKRTILFASFSGEELNLLGSTWYVQHPTRPLIKTFAMINVDHVGIGNGRLTIGVNHFPKEVAALAARRVGLTDKVKLYGFFPGGDHVPFANAGIPTFAVVTAGRHPHFHQTSDTPDTIQPEILHTAAQFIFSLAQQLANEN